MMLPRRVPFIGEVPLPMISRWLRSLTSPTSTQTFEVPMSSATMYFSSVFGIERSSFGVRGRSHRFQSDGAAGALQRLDDDTVLESKIRVRDLAAPQFLGLSDGVEVAPFRREVGGVGVNEGAELAVEEGEAVR